MLAKSPHPPSLHGKSPCKLFILSASLSQEPATRETFCWAASPLSMPTEVRIGENEAKCWVGLQCPASPSFGLYPSPPTLRSCSVTKQPLSSPYPHAHLLSGPGYPRVQEQLHPALMKSFGRLHGYENVPKHQASLSPVSLWRVGSQVLLLPAITSLLGRFAASLRLLRHPLAEPRVLSCFPSPTVPHGEESHTDKEDRGSRETVDEPTAHGSQLQPVSCRTRTTSARTST